MLSSRAALDKCRAAFIIAGPLGRRPGAGPPGAAPPGGPAPGGPAGPASDQAAREEVLDVELINPIVRRWQQEAASDPEAFWARAADQVSWFRKWDRVYEADPPSFRWFSGAQTNLSYNCLDYHVARGWGGHAALVAENERGERRVYTYAQLLEAVKRAAAALRGLGVGRGDRVAIYMPTCPEAIVLMLACARIGAIHLVVFAGFGSGALGDRISLSG